MLDNSIENITELPRIYNNEDTIAPPAKKHPGRCLHLEMVNHCHPLF